MLCLAAHLAQAKTYAPEPPSGMGSSNLATYSETPAIRRRAFTMHLHGPG